MDFSYSKDFLKQNSAEGFEWTIGGPESAVMDLDCRDETEEMDLLTEFVPLQPDELVLSDVYLCSVDSQPTGASNTWTTRFVFDIGIKYRLFESGRTSRKQDPPSSRSSGFEDSVTNNDDDLEIERPELQREVIVLEHTMSTNLDNVGTQVWRGALYLADFILANSSLFRRQTVLELGAGVGLCSIVLGYVGASHVFSTDHSAEVLAICRRNIQSNSQLFPANLTNVAVRELNWLGEAFPTAEAPSPDSGPYSWTSDDLKVLSDGFLVIAADVIYSDELTDAFFNTLLGLAKTFGHRLDVYLALEKRLNFTVEDLAISSPPYRHFQQALTRASRLSGAVIDRVPDTFPQFFQYERVPELVRQTLTKLEQNKLK